MTLSAWMLAAAVAWLAYANGAIGLAWVTTLPMGAVLAAAVYTLAR